MPRLRSNDSMRAWPPAGSQAEISARVRSVDPSSTTTSSSTSGYRPARTVATVSASL